MMDYLAHSAGDNHSAQFYEAHVHNVVTKATDFACHADRFSEKSPGELTNVVAKAAEYHDVGKLDSQNQSVLHNPDCHRHLPVNHVDAGTAYCLSDQSSFGSALTIYAHHRGLPNIPEEANRGKNILRDNSEAVRQLVDRQLDNLINIHSKLYRGNSSHKPEYCTCSPGVFFRLALSCLADADHYDTAVASGNSPVREDIPVLRPEERLKALDNYVSGLQKNNMADVRTELRAQMYSSCRNAELSSSIVSCSSPVGTGKTTAIMAHLLQKASAMKARHIFVVLPFTSIITQSVDVYRKALVLPGEAPEEVVAELHHKADYESEETRHFSALWRAPIIVTTAVAFFETIASNKPAALRRLHELPGSVIFVDEAHTVLPVKLLPIAWKWMQTFSDEWNCHWVLASGSLVKFWNIPEISNVARNVPELVSSSLRSSLEQYEKNRIQYHCIDSPLSRDELIDLVISQPGPRLLIVNTVKNAAVLAHDLEARFGRNHVLHLSTALCAADREKVNRRIKERLLAKENDSDWTLVATSCVEAGVDYSFKTGFRENGSLLSLLQAAGRVNRSGEDSDAKMFSFILQDNPMLTVNPASEKAGRILRRYFKRGKQISPELSTSAIEDEICEYSQIASSLIRREENLEFETVQKEFQVIDSDTVLAVIDSKVVQQIKLGCADWRMLQKYAVPVRRSRIRAYHLREIKGDIYEWTLPYDSFLGIMAGIIAEQTSKEDFLCI